MASRSQPCSRLASVALRALENPPSTRQMLSLAVPLDIEESYFLQGPPLDQAGLTGWVWGANLEEMNWSERRGHFPGHHTWSLCSIKRKDYCLPLLGLLKNHLFLPFYTPMPTPEHLPLTCDYEFQGVARLYLNRACPVRVVAAGVTPYASTRYIGDRECPITTGGSPELH